MTTKNKTQTLDHFKTFINVVRPNLPWLKNRQTIQDCAAAVSYILELQHEAITCHELKNRMIQNKTWHQYDPKKPTLPKTGDTVIFDWQGNHTGTDHTGLVLEAHPGSLTYISANSGNTHLVKINTVNYTVITGFGRPATYKTETSKP